jgi:hypothetical protein
MGLENLMPSNSLAMAVASNRPIQIGNVLSPSTSFRMTMGLFVNGSTVKPEMTMGLCMLSSLSSISTYLGKSLLFVNLRFPSAHFQALKRPKTDVAGPGDKKLD